MKHKLLQFLLKSVTSLANVLLFYFSDWLLLKLKLKPNHQRKIKWYIRVYIGGFMYAGARWVKRHVAAPGGAGEAWRQVAGKFSLLPRRWAASKGLHLCWIAVIWDRREGWWDGRERLRKRDKRERERYSTWRRLTKWMTLFCCLHFTTTHHLAKLNNNIL